MGDNKFLGLVLMSAFWVVLSAFLHTRSTSFSMINYRAEGVEVANNFISESYLKSTVELHESHPSFARRPLSTRLLRTLDHYTALSLGQAFVGLQFFLLFLCGPLLYYLARLCHQSENDAWLSVALFYSSFSILFAFFPSLYTYDEPLQFLLLLLALVFWQKKKWASFAGVFTLALVTRETALLLLPGMALWMLPERLGSKAFWNWKNTAALVALVIPVLAYGLYWYWWNATTEWTPAEVQELASRWQLIAYNFQNSQFAIESVCSMLLGWGVPTFTLFYIAKKIDFTETEKAWSKAFLLSLFLNSLLVFVATKARETRLFALPLLLLWPLAGRQLRLLISGWRTRRFSSPLSRNSFIVVILLLLFLALMIPLHLYRPTGLDASQNWHKPYFFLLLSFIFLASIFYFWPERGEER